MRHRLKRYITIACILLLVFLLGYASSGPLRIESLDYSLSAKSIASLLMVTLNILILIGAVGLLITAFVPGSADDPGGKPRSSLAAILVLALVFSFIMRRLSARDSSSDTGPEQLFPNSPAPLSEMTGSQSAAADGLSPLLTNATVVIWWIAMVAVPMAILIMIVGSMRRPRRHESEPEGQRIQQDMAALSQTVEASLTELENEPDARKAIIACYQHFLHLLSREGVTVPRHFTPEESLYKALKAFPIPEEAAQTLTNCFRLARYSTHEITGLEKGKTIEALKQCRDSISSLGEK